MNRILMCLVPLTLTACGCGRSDLPELGDVSGHVTLDGQPLADAIVNFTPVGEGRPSTAQTDAEGYYELQYLADVSGALIGEHVVTIEPVVTEEMDDYDEENPQAGGTAPPQLPASATDGSLRENVVAGSNSIDIQLSSGGSSS
ncbi:MAG: carboxypeptidase-like regulatory domain-containing protein [Maioricimonas sp. JB045]|uniref:carboxypeptidase-like regulatory domain-containing protein n=1 Tax=Maioricimonas sp. JC845 TaxID=3232138 RepID=UPI0034598F7C